MEILSASVSRVLASDVIHVSVGECECLLTTTWVLGPAQRHALRVRRNPTRQRVWGSTHIENARLDLVGLEERSQNQVTLLAATSAISVPDRGYVASELTSICKYESEPETRSALWSTLQVRCCSQPVHPRRHNVGCPQTRLCP